MDRKIEIEQELTGLTSKVNRLKEEMKEIVIDNHKKLIGKCYRESEFSIIMITDVEDVWKDIVFVEGLRIQGSRKEKSYELSVIRQFQLEFYEEEYTEITKEEFYEFFDKSVDMTREYIKNQIWKAK